VVLGACCITKPEEEKGVIGTSFIVPIQGITICSLVGGYHLLGSTFGESVANSLVLPPQNSSFLPKEKKVGLFIAYCLLSLTITIFSYYVPPQYSLTLIPHSYGREYLFGQITNFI
jgi:hypothetical protein